MKLPGNQPNAQLVVTIDEETLFAIAIGKVKLRQAFINGKLKLQGAINDTVQTLETLFQAIQPYANL